MVWMRILVIVCFAQFLLAEDDGDFHTIPDYIKVCKKDDPKLGSCLRKSIVSLRPYLNQGVKELEIPALNPLVIPEIKLSQNSGAINLESSYKNIVIHGATRFRMRSVKIDLDQNKMRCKLWFPELTMKATYSIRGKLLMMPLNGSGTCHGNFTDIDATMALKTDRIMKNGKEHYKVKDLSIEFNIGNAVLHLDNIFNGDPEISESLNRFINENWRVMTAEIRPTLEATLADIVKDVADKIFDKFPLEKLLE